MKKLISLAAVSFAAIATISACGNASNGVSTKIETASDSLSYAIGVSMGNQLKQWGFSTEDINPAIVAGGLNDVLTGKDTQISPQEAGETMQNYIMVTIPARNKSNSAKFLDEAKKEKGAQVTASGIVYVIENEGDANLRPLAADTVVVDYEGKLSNGEIFDSSIKRGEPATFTLNRVILGWQEGMQLIGKGGHIKLWIPSELAYGEYGSGPIGGNQALYFDVQLLDVKKAKEVETK